MEERRLELSAYRDEKELTQAQMAEILKISERTYRRYEKGERSIPDSVYEAFLQLKEVKKEKNRMEKKAERPDELLCPYKVKTISHKNGVITQFFLRCVKGRCALWDGVSCRRKV